MTKTFLLSMLLALLILLQIGCTTPNEPPIPIEPSPPQIGSIYDRVIDAHAQLPSKNVTFGDFNTIINDLQIEFTVSSKNNTSGLHVTEDSIDINRAIVKGVVGAGTFSPSGIYFQIVYNPGNIRSCLVTGFIGSATSQGIRLDFSSSASDISNCTMADCDTAIAAAGAGFTIVRNCIAAATVSGFGSSSYDTTNSSHNCSDISAADAGGKPSYRIKGGAEG